MPNMMVTCKNEGCAVGFQAPSSLQDAALHDREVGPTIGQCPSCGRSFPYEVSDLDGEGPVGS